MSSKYFVCTKRGGEVQGPFATSRVREWIADGRIRADMWFCKDGAAWVQGHELPDLFPAPASGSAQAPPPPLGQSVPGPPPVEIQRQHSQATPTPRLALAGSPLALLGIGALFGMALMAALMSAFSGSTDLTSSLGTSSGSGLLEDETTGMTRSAFLKKIGWNGYVLSTTKDEFIALAGSPHSTQKVGDEAYWYYQCSDGQLQVVMLATLLHHGRVLINEINEY